MEDFLQKYIYISFPLNDIIDEENENECISEIIQSENEEDENDRIVTDNGNYRIQFHVAK